MTRAGFGRALFGLGLVVMLLAVVYGVQNDALGTEIVAAFAGFLLCMIGRSLGGASRPQ